jgi:hypothetical protein
MRPKKYKTFDLRIQYACGKKDLIKFLEELVKILKEQYNVK